jgi:hypothetical protein
MEKTATDQGVAEGVVDDVVAGLDVAAVETDVRVKKVRRPPRKPQRPLPKRPLPKAKLTSFIPKTNLPQKMKTKGEVKVFPMPSDVHTVNPQDPSIESEPLSG